MEEPRAQKSNVVWTESDYTFMYMLALLELSYSIVCVCVYEKVEIFQMNTKHTAPRRAKQSKNTRIYTEHTPSSANLITVSALVVLLS